MSVVAVKDEKFTDHFGDFVGWRMEAPDDVLNDPEYRKAADEEREVTQEIKQLLGDEEGFRLINKYCTAYTTKWAISQRRIYKLGIADGVRLCIELGIIAG